MTHAGDGLRMIQDTALVKEEIINMNFKNASVTHKRFGNGFVQSLDGEVLTIRFQQYGTRTFRFPDVFLTDLKTDDPAFACHVAEALVVKK